MANKPIRTKTVNRGGLKSGKPISIPSKHKNGSYKVTAAKKDIIIIKAIKKHL